MGAEQENTVKNTVRPALNGGHFITGNPGNKGGPGRPPNELRALAREGAEPFIKGCNKIVKDPLKEGSYEFFKAGESIVKIGLPTQVEDVSVTVEAQQVLEVMATVLADVAKENNWPETVIDTIFERYASKIDKKSAES